MTATHSKTHIERHPVVSVLRAFGSCPAGYRVGERTPVNLRDPRAAFRCSGAFEAMQPYFETLRKTHGGEDPGDCQYVGSCDCQLAPTEMVFYLYTEPERVE
jgi:uncharacterized repeat protein (TIGR04076 family)